MMTEPVKIRITHLPNGESWHEEPTLEAALLWAEKENCGEFKYAEVRVAPGVWYSPNPCSSSFVD
jgi:hypothetical protein